MQGDSECGRYMLASIRYCIRSKPVGTPNSPPSAEESGDYKDTLMPIQSLNHRCVEPLNRSASTEKNCKPKSKPGKISNTLYRRRASDGLRRSAANISKEATANLPGPCCEMESFYQSGNRIDAGRNTKGNNKCEETRGRVS